MTSHPFCRYDLRTLDVDGARAFYTQALDLDVARPGSGLAVWPLHEQARARGVPAHWLGHIAVSNLSATVEQLVGAGAQLLGPPVLRGADGEGYAVLRDPCEAIVAVRETTVRPDPPPVVWHQLHTRDLDRSCDLYTRLFGWVQTDTFHTSSPAATHRLFRWPDAAASTGSIGDTATLPGVHAHWLYSFPVTSLDARLEAITRHGGRTLGPFALPAGDRLAACEDPQGAAFGLFERAPVTAA